MYSYNCDNDSKCYITFKDGTQLSIRDNEINIEEEHNFNNWLLKSLQRKFYKSLE